MALYCSIINKKISICKKNLTTITSFVLAPAVASEGTDVPKLNHAQLAGATASWVGRGAPCPAQGVHIVPSAGGQARDRAPF